MILCRQKNAYYYIISIYKRGFSISTNKQTIGERVKAIRKDQRLNQERFGKALGGLQKSSISKIEKSENGLSQRNLKTLCQTFHVNEQWLLTGEGEMYLPASQEEMIQVYMQSILSNRADIAELQLHFFKSLSNLSEDDWVVLDKIVTALAEQN